MPTYTITKTLQRGAETITGTKSYSGDAALEFDITVADTGQERRTGTLDVSELVYVFLESTVAMRIHVNGVNEVQSLAITGTPTGGTFTLTYSGQTTSALAYNATAAQVQAALEALSNIGAGDVSCTGGPLPGTAIAVQFRGALAATNVAQMTTTDSLTGGTAPASAVTTTTAGVAAGQTIDLEANNPLEWGEEEGYHANPLSVDWTHLLVSNDSGAAGNFYCRALYN